MNLKKYMNKTMKLTYWEFKFSIIVTLLLTLFFVNIWPRFRADVLEFPWYFYIILIALFLIPIFKKVK